MRLVMCPTLISFLLLGLAASTGAGAEPQSKLVLDLWDAAYVQGARAGYVHTYVQELDKESGKLLRAAMELRLTVLRSGQTIQLGMDSGTYETPDGKVVGTFLKHFLGKAKTLEITGIVDAGVLRLTLDKGKNLKPAEWDPEVIGLARQQRLAQERDMKPGKEFNYLSFEPSINVVVKNTVRAKDFEDVELFGGKGKKRLLRVESRTEKIQNVQMPTLVSWLGDDLTPLRSEAEIPPFGRVILYRTTKAAALSAGTLTKLTDIGTNQQIKLARRISNPYETTAAVYRITIRDDEDPATVFAQDERQQVTKVQGKTFEIRVSAGGKGEETKEPPSEYTQSSYFITCDDARVRTLAQRAVGGETDPWKKALRIEKWVNLNMKTTSDEALAPADHVARTLRGDCTEFAMLTAAMCRAESLPSRTAVGLIYADVRSGPIFAFHMWTEVWVRGSWVPLDATLGKGRVGATHLKIAHQSWHDVYDQAPLLPVFRVLGKLSIDVVRTEGR
jgi:transglutaminase-like putative cysteine protease